MSGPLRPGEGLNPENYLGGTEAGNPPGLEPELPDDTRTGHNDPCVEDPESTDEEDCYEVECDGMVQLKYESNRGRSRV